MATYTVAELKDLSSVSDVTGGKWSDDRILLLQSTAESILESMDLDVTATGYAAAYDNAVVMIFDWLADNPTGLKQVGRGKVSKTFSDILPAHIIALLRKFMDGASGNFVGADIRRKDIGLR
jgi:hypothetical protein